VSLPLILECFDKASFLLLHFGLNVIVKDWVELQGSYRLLPKH